MQIEIKLEAGRDEPKVVIFTSEMTEEVHEILQKIGGASIERIVGFSGGVATVLQVKDIIRLFTENQKVFAETQGGRYQIKTRMYELENSLQGSRFVRISQSEIVSLAWVENMDLSLSGTICIRLKNEATCFVSRRYINKFKKILAL